MHIQPFQKEEMKMYRRSFPKTKIIASKPPCSPSLQPVAPFGLFMVVEDSSPSAQPDNESLCPVAAKRLQGVPTIAIHERPARAWIKVPAHPRESRHEIQPTSTHSFLGKQVLVHGKLKTTDSSWPCGLTLVDPGAGSTLIFISRSDWCPWELKGLLRCWTAWGLAMAPTVCGEEFEWDFYVTETSLMFES